MYSPGRRKVTRGSVCSPCGISRPFGYRLVRAIRFRFPPYRGSFQRFTFPLDPEITSLPVDPESLFRDNAARFISRARRAPVRQADALRADAMAQVQDG